jgi:hypothetical protein
MAPRQRTSGRLALVFSMAFGADAAEHEDSGDDEPYEVRSGADLLADRCIAARSFLGRMSGLYTSTYLR